MKKNPFKNLKLDAYEQEIEDALRRGEFKSDPNFAKRKKEFQAVAAYTLKLLKKNKNINIRLPEMTLNKIKSKANHEGLPYQTLIGSILHKYVNGTL